MMLVQDWLVGRNLQKSGDNARKLEGEALTYLMVTFLTHPEDIPQEVVEVLAEQVFGQFVGEAGYH